MMPCLFHARRRLAIACAALLLACAGAARAQDAPAWVNVTNNVGGDTWGYAGVCTVACPPGAGPWAASDLVIAGVSKCGLWASTDGGATWKQLGDHDTVKITNRPFAIVFDPKDGNTFWECGSYGPVIFRTVNGGQSFERLGDLKDADALSIDFTDPQRQTLVLGLHEQSRSVHVSHDGGKTWANIGQNLPENTNHSPNVLALDSKTYLAGVSGWAQKTTSGIFRTDDGGQTWSKVSNFAPAGMPLRASDGTLYWSLIYDSGVARSADQGKTWEKLDSPLKRAPIELPGGRLVGAVKTQLHTSTDAGKSWHAFGPPLPWAPGVLAYQAKRSAFFISRSSDKKIDYAVGRLDVPKDAAGFYGDAGR